ncbi:MAG: bifunctional diaminohydroxyphosphoribosylaminopyrimidine deaminase/5-amino-6-(5-phosphoribosylamino)uracil reductase RibD [Syntrophobacteraceae bacterium]|jgi:diaminohydroxyphosphoribosylaminopyrimidine deaminase/5-amino-6-(5-phosphoribosylamino)uracil reductase|nr:bifunctional diaminohydroxyphosphoribosylaminopyrimidine deaminase/5-amino-6-(5-phosphoribosylamino)uracil reductase RibD [Syntrophobacteraceae bacterium]
MKKALALAARGRGWTSPNPMVGAVVVRQGEVVGEGYHRRVGEAHAEVNALLAAGERARGADLYVTLEPCNHHGRTPPCSRAVLESGIMRVVVGMKDPNPQVRGGGSEFLRSHGAQVMEGVLEEACRRLNQPFIKHAIVGRPYVVLKAAATLDGRMATRSGDSRWVSNEQSRRFVHRLRCDLDAILVGSGTARADDPRLTARPTGKRRCRQPVRIVLDSQLNLPLESELVRSIGKAPLWLACGETAPGEREEALVRAGATVIRLPGDRRGLDLGALMDELGKRQIGSLLVEGGGRTLGSFIDGGLADAFYFFYAPRILADDAAVPMAAGVTVDRMAGATPVYDVQLKRFQGDILIHGRFREHLY